MKNAMINIFNYVNVGVRLKIIREGTIVTNLFTIDLQLSNISNLVNELVQNMSKNICI